MPNLLMLEHKVSMPLDLMVHPNLPLRGWLVPGDCHNVPLQTDATVVLNGHEDMPLF